VIPTNVVALENSDPYRLQIHPIGETIWSLNPNRFHCSIRLKADNVAGTSSVSIRQIANSGDDLFGDNLFGEGDVAQFQRDGYVIARQFLSDSLRREMLHIIGDHLERGIGPVEYEADLHYPGAPPSQKATGGKTIRRLKQAHSRGMIFTECVTQPRLLGRLRQLLGPQIVMPLAHHNCVMTKQPTFSSDTRWHQDVRYWSFMRPELISVWFAMGREFPDNGCLRLIPGSHRIDVGRDRLDDDLFFRPDLPQNQELIEQQITAELEPGDALFFHARVLHAADRNRTDRTKFSTVFTFRPQDNPPRPGSRSASLPEFTFSVPDDA